LPGSIRIVAVSWLLALNEAVTREAAMRHFHANAFGLTTL
jgi:hypothetical protein